MLVIEMSNKNNFFENICFELTINFIFDKIATQLKKQIETVKKIITI